MKYIAKLALWCLRFSDKETKRKILRESVKHLFCTVSAEEILRLNPDNSMSFEGKTLDPSFKKDLVTQAGLLENLLLWKVLKKDIEYQLRLKTFEEAKCDEDVVWGQLLTFLWDTINTRIQRLKRNI